MYREVERVSIREKVTVLTEAGTEEMHVTDEGWGHKPRNAGNHMKLRKSKAKDSPPRALGRNQPYRHLDITQERLILDFKSLEV